MKKKPGYSILCWSYNMTHIVFEVKFNFAQFDIGASYSEGLKFEASSKGIGSRHFHFYYVVSYREPETGVGEIFFSQ